MGPQPLRHKHGNISSSSASLSSASRRDATSRLLLGLLTFAVIVFVATTCLLAAGLTAHMEDEQNNVSPERRGLGGGGEGIGELVGDHYVVVERDAALENHFREYDAKVKAEQRREYAEFQAEKVEEAKKYQQKLLRRKERERAEAAERGETVEEEDPKFERQQKQAAEAVAAARKNAARAAAAAKDNPIAITSDAAGDGAGASADTPHLSPPTPYLPPHAAVPNQIPLIESTLSGQHPTIAGIHAILQNFLLAMHKSNRSFNAEAKQKGTNEMKERLALRDKVIAAFVNLANEHLVPLDAAYRGRSVFPVREDGSIYMSLASFRDHLLGATLKDAFKKAANPDKLFIGAVVQNCFGVEYTCRTGAQVVGKDEHGRDKTKVSDAPPDRNGVAEFCEDPAYTKYCEAGQIRALYVNETESLGPAMARYYASKLWGGETYYMQADAHLRFAPRWDQRYIDEVKAAKAYPKAVLSSYPPGFNENDPDYKGGSRGARLCTCEFSSSDVEEHIIRINTGSHCDNPDVDGPTQVAFIAAGFFFAHAEFLTDVPFDPFLPWCFMGEEIALSIRAWTAGWDIYAPRENLIAHQYRPGRMGLPKFWGSVGRLFGREGPGFNTKLQKKLIQRVKHLVGYIAVTREQIIKDGSELVLTELEHYGLGTVRTKEDYIALTAIDFQRNKCNHMTWCNKCELA